MRLSNKKLAYEIPVVKITMLEDVDIVTNSNVDEGSALPLNGDWWYGKSSVNSDYLNS